MINSAPFVLFLMIRSKSLLYCCSILISLSKWIFSTSFGISFRSRKMKLFCWKWFQKLVIVFILFQVSGFKFQVVGTRINTNFIFFNRKEHKEGTKLSKLCYLLSGVDLSYAIRFTIYSRFIFVFLVFVIMQFIYVCL